MRTNTTSVKPIGERLRRHVGSCDPALIGAAGLDHIVCLKTTRDLRMALHAIAAAAESSKDQLKTG
jgi:hypothetical protein